MANQIKADIFRIIKERRLILPTLLAMLFALLFSMMTKNDRGELGLISAVSSFSTIIPLFFTSSCSIFLGDDYTFRTINNHILKQKSRLNIFLYKSLMTFFLSMSYIFISYLAIALSRIVLGDHFLFKELISLILYQLPTMMCINMLCILIFNYADRVYQAYLIYVVIILMFDNLASFVVEALFKTNSYNIFFLINNLREITGKGVLLTDSITVAIIFTTVYFIICYHIFKLKEFK